MRRIILTLLSGLISLSACSDYAKNQTEVVNDGLVESERCVFENHNIDIAALQQTETFASLSWIQPEQVLGGVLPGSAAIRISLFQCHHHGAEVQLLINPFNPEGSVKHAFSAFEQFFPEEASRQNLRTWLQKVDLAATSDGIYLENALEQTGYDEVFLQYTDVNGQPLLVFGFRGF